MKFKVRFQRRYSVMITIIACASSILMMVKRFGFPEEQVVQIIWVSLGFLLAIILIAAPIAFLGRWIAERGEKKASLDQIEQKDP